MKDFPEDISPAQFMRDFNAICLGNLRSVFSLNPALKKAGYFVLHESSGTAMFGSTMERPSIKTRQSGRKGMRCQAMAIETPALRSYVAQSLQNDPRYISKDGSFFETDTDLVTTGHSPLPSGKRVFWVAASWKAGL
jgi:hypothetical protein